MPPQFTLRPLLMAMLVVGAAFGWPAWLVPRLNDKPTTVAQEVVEIPEDLLVRNLRETFRERFAGSNTITFLSWNGQWIGTDIDTEIRLMADGTVQLTEYGDAVDTYDGTYSIVNDFELMLSLKGYGAAWPTMRVHRDRSALLLARADGSIHATRNGSHWPFRQTD